MQTTLNKKYNYGILKPTIDIDGNRINWDYLAGLIYTDGNIVYNEYKHTHKPNYRVTIAQDHLKFLNAIQEYLFKQNYYSSIFKVKGAYHLYFYNKKLVEFFNNYTFKKCENKKSFLAGMIDGDGSFCSHKSNKRTYWRFQFGCSKEREINHFQTVIDWFNFSYNKRINKNGIYAFDICKSDKLIELIETIKDYVIIKKEVIELIYPQLLEFEKNKWITCKYCEEKFLNRYSNHSKREHCCKKIECTMRYNADRMRKLRKRWLVQKNLGHCNPNTTQRYIQYANVDLTKIINPLDRQLNSMSKDLLNKQST